VTVPNTGNITSNQISGVTKGDLSGQINLNSAGSRQVAGKSSGNISFVDFRGRAWVQGNIGDLPTNKDPRPFQGGANTSNSYISGSGSEWVCHLNQQYQSSPGAVDCNSFFYCSSPGVPHKFLFNFRTQMSYSPGSWNRYGAVTVFAYDAGYSAGSRVQLGQYKIEDSNYNSPRSMSFTPPASHRYVSIVVTSWGVGNYSGGTNEVTTTLSNGIITLQ